MSEHLDDHGLFEHLAMSMQDPYLDRKMDQARKKADELNEGEPTYDDRDEAIRKLDMDWIYARRELVVSGIMWLRTPQSREYERAIVRDLEVVSDGFAFDKEKVVVNGEFVEGKLVPSFSFHVKDAEHPRAFGHAMMHFEDIDHIEYPFPSDELRVQQFRYHSPELAKEIDRVVFIARNTTDMISDLSDLVTFERDPDDTFDSGEVADLQSYLNHVMDLDTLLPYRVMVMGEMGVMGDKNHVKINEITQPSRKLAIVGKVRMLAQDLTMHHQGGKQAYIPYLDVTLFESQRAVEPKRTLIPFSSIITAESIRDEE